MADLAAILPWRRALPPAEPPLPASGRLAEAEAALAAERALSRQSGVLDHLPGPALDPVVFGFGPPR